MRPHHSIFVIMTAAAAAAFPISVRAQEPAKAPFLPPAAYLNQADSVLNGVPKNVSHDASKQLDELRTHFDELNKAYLAQKDQVGPPLTRQDPTKDIPTWRDNFSDVERDLVVLIGGGSSLTPSAVSGSEVVAPNPAAVEPGAPASTITSSNPAPVGTTGTIPATPATSALAAPSTNTSSAASAAPNGTTTNASSSGTSAADGSAAPAAAPPPAANTAAASSPSAAAPISASPAAAGGTLAMADSLAASKVSVTGLKDLDPAVRSQLEQFRLQVELFYSATMGSLR